MPTVKEIVEAYLREHGYDGLYDGEVGCGCCLDDLMPCAATDGCVADECRPGYRAPCDCEEEHAFHIVAERKKDG